MTLRFFLKFSLLLILLLVPACGQRDDADSPPGDSGTPPTEDTGSPPEDADNPPGDVDDPPEDADDPPTEDVDDSPDDADNPPDDEPVPDGDVTPPSSDVDAELVALLEKYLAPTDTSVALSVSSSEKTHVAAYGLANLAAGTPVQLTDYFRIGSTSKPMVSAALLTFVEAGDIALDDPIADYLPDAVIENLVNVDSTTVRQMLQMTSGIPDYLGTDAFLDAVDDAPDTFWTPEQVLEFAYDEPAEFAPGADYYYSNSNYILAQIIIEELSGQTLAVVLTEKVFTPAGMTNCYLETADTFAENIIRGYDNATDGNQLVDVTEINDGVGLGDGGVVCTLDSFAKFLPALLAGDILGEDVLAEMLKSVPAGDSAPYGLGIDVEEDGEFGRTIGHSGATSGFASLFKYLPEDNLSVVAMTNFVESAVLDDIVADALEWWFD